MFAPGQPVPATYVPWRQDESVREASLMNVSYSDRSHALRAQDLNHACLSGVPPPGLPSWPPKHVISYPGSSRMTDNQAGNAANTASEEVALRHLETAGQIQPARTTFHRDATGALTVSSVPVVTSDVPPAQASQARVRIKEWERHGADRAARGVGEEAAAAIFAAAGPNAPAPGQETAAIGAATGPAMGPAMGPADGASFAAGAAGAAADHQDAVAHQDIVTAMSSIDDAPVAVGAAVVRIPDAPTDPTRWLVAGLSVVALVAAAVNVV